MPMKPLAGLFLALACVLGIATTGCVFELAYGDPDLGVSHTDEPSLSIDDEQTELLAQFGYIV